MVDESLLKAIHVESCTWKKKREITYNGGAGKN